MLVNKAISGSLGVGNVEDKSVAEVYGELGVLAIGHES